MYLTGVDDVHFFYSPAAHEALQASHSGFRIAAVHSPEAADVAAAAGVRLYLCGHTHGGQICLPGGRPLLTRLGRCRGFARGLWQCGEMVGFTSTGAGYSGIPIRFNCPPEVARITLKRVQ